MDKRVSVPSAPQHILARLQGGSGNCQRFVVRAIALNHQRIARVMCLAYKWMMRFRRLSRVIAVHREESRLFLVAPRQNRDSRRGLEPTIGLQVASHKPN